MPVNRNAINPSQHCHVVNCLLSDPPQLKHPGPVGFAIEPSGELSHRIDRIGLETLNNLGQPSRLLIMLPQQHKVGTVMLKHLRKLSNIRGVREKLGHSCYTRRNHGFVIESRLQH